MLKLCSTPSQKLKKSKCTDFDDLGPKTLASQENQSYIEVLQKKYMMLQDGWVFVMFPKGGTMFP